MTQWLFLIPRSKVGPPPQRSSPFRTGKRNTVRAQVDGVAPSARLDRLMAMLKGSLELRAVATEVTNVYRDLADRPVERNCLRRKDCCHFKLTGQTPLLTKGEALLAAQALRRTGRKQLPAPRNGACPLLDQGGDCLIYADRPFGCRTHFCAAAGGPYARREVLDLIRRLEELDRSLGGDGAHEIVGAISHALAQLA